MNSVKFEPLIILRVNLTHKIQRQAVVEVLRKHGLFEGANFIEKAGNYRNHGAVRLNCPGFNLNNPNDYHGQSSWSNYQRDPDLPNIKEVLWFESLEDLDIYFTENPI